MQWYLKVLKQYADFNSRARRKEYWMFFLFNMIFSFATFFIDMMAGTTIPEVGYGIFYIVYGLAMFIPGIAVSVRRLHDVGKSGWMLLIAFIPLIGAIWLLVLAIRNGDEGDNAYGQDPKIEIA